MVVQIIWHSQQFWNLSPKEEGTPPQRHGVTLLSKGLDKTRYGSIIFGSKGDYQVTIKVVDKSAPVHIKAPLINPLDPVLMHLSSYFKEPFSLFSH